MTDKTDILIVGAGPSGLMLACQLLKHGINFLIIDKSEHIKRSSGALVIHAASMELFFQMGILDQVLLNAVPVNLISISVDKYSSKKTINTGSFIPSVEKKQTYNLKYPPIILLEQYKMECILKECIAKQSREIMIGTFVGYEKTGENEVACHVQIGGQGHTILCRYLIGADGKESRVRESAGISFHKFKDNRPIFILDFEGKTPASIHEMSFFFSRSISMGCFPLKENVIRLDGYIPKLLKLKGTLKVEQILPYLPVDIKIDKIKWFSVFHGNYLLCDTFSESHIFLIGDAAHTHNPVGGQGMNSGFQDALNLGWKLAFVIKGLACEKLLDSYTIERRPVVKKIMVSSTRVFKSITSSKLANRLIFMYSAHFFFPILKLLTNLQFVRRQIFLNISQLWIKYRSQLIVGSDCSKLIPGMLFNTSLLEISLKESTMFRLILFRKTKVPLNYHELETFPLDIFELEEYVNPVIFEVYGIKKDTAVLLRPDNFIAMSTTDHYLKPIQQYFRELT